MLLFLSMSIFAHNDRFGSWILVEKNLDKYKLPTEQLHLFRSKNLANKTIEDILGIKWNLLLRQEGLYEKDDHSANLVYSVYLEDKVPIKNQKYSWLKLSSLDQLDPFHQTIIQNIATKRF